MIYQTIKEEHHRLQKQICELQNQISQYPDGKLICSQGQNCFKWYKSDGHVKTYIPKSNRILAEQLAAKKYLSHTLKKLIREKNALERYLKHHKEPDPSDDDRIISNPGYRELLSPYFKLDSDEQTEWMNAPYEKNLNHPEHLIHKTIAGICVRSKSESMILHFLYANHIPFRYECVLQLGETTLYPDFTILHPQTGKVFYWEHFGRMDDPVYARTVCAKLQLYITNGIIPGIQLITTYESNSIPLDFEEISWVASHYFL